MPSAIAGRFTRPRLQSRGFNRMLNAFARLTNGGLNLGTLKEMNDKLHLL